MLTRFLTGALLAVSLLAQGLTPSKPASPLNNAVLEAYFRHLFVWAPNVEVAISDPTPAPMPGYFALKVRGTLSGHSQEASFYVSADSQNIISGQVFNVNASPFEADLKILKTDNQPVLGPPGAPVTVVEFADFQCPYCKQEAGVVRNQLMAAFPGQVRLVYMDFPLDQIHPFARGAAVMGRCIYTQNNDSFWAYHDWVFQHQGEITAENLRAKAIEYAKGDKNLDLPALTACTLSPEPRTQVDRTVAMGGALKITATPTLFINGRRMVGTIALENLVLVVQHEIAWAKAHPAKAAADCCSIQLSLPGMGKAAAQ
jgi:protein-disulfide isomerase